VNTRRTVWQSLASLPLLASLWPARAKAQTPQFPTGAPGQMMLTIFLRHDESKTVDEINQHLKKTGWFNNFPPQGVEIVSWYVMMGIGQVVTLRFAAERLREINRLVEGEAWGGFRTEFYATYDYRGLWEELRRKEARQ
jgi:hypothetical protein